MMQFAVVYYFKQISVVLEMPCFYITSTILFKVVMTPWKQGFENNVGKGENT